MRSGASRSEVKESSMSEEEKDEQVGGSEPVQLYRFKVRADDRDAHHGDVHGKHEDAADARDEAELAKAEVATDAKHADELDSHQDQLDEKHGSEQAKLQQDLEKKHT